MHGFHTQPVMYPMKWSQTLASETGLNLLQTLARTLFALLALLYFVHSDGLLLIQPALCWALLALYLVVQISLLRWRSGVRRWLANLIDLAAITGLVVFDPQPTPPTLLLFLVFTLSAGVLFGLRTFLFMLVAATCATALALLLHDGYLGVAPSGGSLFLVATLALCALYFLLLLARNQLLARSAEKAAWRNPRTQLISQRALISTAGWLVPLHDRMGATLSVVLLAPANDASETELASYLCERIRGSDIAGHFGDSLALLLPCTSAGAAEALLRDLHTVSPIFHAAIITLADASQALEPVLLHLEKSLGRAQEDAQHWLVHAPRLP